MNLQLKGLTLVLSLATLTCSPSTPALPSTLILSIRNFSKEAISMILSSTGCTHIPTEEAGPRSATETLASVCAATENICV